MILKKRQEELVNYLDDTSNVRGAASALYVPQSTREVAECLRDVSTKKIPLTVSAGRTGTTGGCVPYAGAILSTERLDRIHAIDADGRTVSLGSGVPLEILEKEAARFGLCLRAQPTESLAYIGGAISTQASGVRGFGHGSIRPYVRELEVVLTSGDSIRIVRGGIRSRGRRFDYTVGSRNFGFPVPSYTMPGVKSQAGYFVHDGMDLIDLFIGSEGTLGVITECVLSLQPVPFRIFDILAFFKDEREALACVESVKKKKLSGELTPASLEFFDEHALGWLRTEYSFVPQSGVALYIEQEAQNDGDYDVVLQKWQKLLQEHGADLEKSIFADTANVREKVFAFRHRLPQLINEFLRRTGQRKCATDCAVSPDTFASMYAFYKEEARVSALDYVNFGHIGESHLHFNFLPKNEEESLRALRGLERICKKACSLGGSVSAEHGIGKIKKPYLKFMYSERHIREMAHLKKYLDPACILGLDNIFEKELLFA